MLNRAPSLGRLTLVCAILAALIGLLLTVHCTHGSAARLALAPLPDEAPIAHLTVLNSSECEWQIAFTASAGGGARTWKLPAAKMLKIELAGGDYRVEQTMLTANADATATRRFALHLEPGETYRWRLMTLLSNAAAEMPPSALMKGSHE